MNFFSGVASQSVPVAITLEEEEAADKALKGTATEAVVYLCARARAVHMDCR